MLFKVCIKSMFISTSKASKTRQGKGNKAPRQQGKFRKVSLINHPCRISDHMQEQHRHHHHRRRPHDPETRRKEHHAYHA